MISICNLGGIRCVHYDTTNNIYRNNFSTGFLLSNYKVREAL